MGVLGRADALQLLQLRGSLGSLSSLPSGYHTPTLVIQGTNDKTVDHSNGPAVAKLAHGQLWTIQGGTHTSAFSMCSTQYISQVHTFFSDASAVPANAFSVNQSC